jgi:phospho-N-acetylmuramoyl-pentapeptide-transferase
MLYALADFSNVWGPFRLFNYITFRTLGAGLTAFLLGLAIAPWCIAKLANMKQALRTQAEVGKLADLHAGKQGTPTMGGLIIFAAVMISSLLWAKLNLLVGLALLVYVGLTAVGFADDYLKVSRKNSKGLNSRYKIAAQALLTLVVVTAMAFASPERNQELTRLCIPFLKNPIEIGLILTTVFFFFVLAGTSNAINLTDGVDGLAIGCTVSNALVFAIIAYMAGNAVFASYLDISFIPGAGELAVVLGALLGGSMAFLWYNAYPATIFMGDTGSLAIGGLLGTVAFLIHQPILLVIVGGIFVMECASDIIQIIAFKTTGKRVFRMAPIHHHFQLGGWHENKLVIRFWILSLLFALLGLATLKLR